MALERAISLTSRQAPRCLESTETSLTSSPIPDTVFCSSPRSCHAFAKPAEICEGVKNGATPLMRISCFWASVCEARSSPVTPCLDETYPATPVEPKYPDVELIRTMDPLEPSSKHLSLFRM